MNRGISTVLDVGFAIVLVGASVAVLSGVPTSAPDHGADADVGGVSVAGSTLTVEYERRDGQSAIVTGTVAGHLRDAALARRAGVGADYVRAVERQVADRVEVTGARTQLVGACSVSAGVGDDSRGATEPVVAGPAPPTGEPVDATVYRWNAVERPPTVACDPVVVVRRWSP
ncbi:MAG: hypothetical protein ABEJ44_06490 [Halanaeroarchaeum sp.]